MSGAPNHEITYNVKIPADLVEQAVQALKSMGIKLDPVKNIVGIDYDVVEGNAQIAQGDEIPELAKGINRYLISTGLTPLVPIDHENWGPVRAWEFLELASNWFIWDGYMVTNNWWQTMQTTWQELASSLPALFPNIGE